MNKAATTDVLVLETNLFPDASTLENAIAAAGGELSPHRLVVEPDTMDVPAWDDVLTAILAARVIITL